MIFLIFIDFIGFLFKALAYNDSNKTGENYRYYKKKKYIEKDHLVRHMCFQTVKKCMMGTTSLLWGPYYLGETFLSEHKRLPGYLVVNLFSSTVATEDSNRNIENMN